MLLLRLGAEQERERERERGAEGKTGEHQEEEEEEEEERAVPWTLWPYCTPMTWGLGHDSLPSQLHMGNIHPCTMVQLNG